jgi:hypothetical protein
VSRVEYEVRGEALDELDMRLPIGGQMGAAAHAEKLGAALDGLWAYGTQKWLRLVRRGEGYVQPRWRAVQSATFVAAAEPRERERKRGAAKAPQASGAAFSLLGAMHALPPIPWPARIDEQTGEVVDAVRINDDARNMVVELVNLHRATSPEAADALAKATLRRDLSSVFSAAAEKVFDYEVDRAAGDGQKALARTWTKWGAALARFSPPVEKRDGDELADELREVG